MTEYATRIVTQVTLVTAEQVMPTRRTFELVIITIILAQPALAMIHLWARKHLATAAAGATADAAAVVTQVI